VECFSTPQLQSIQFPRLSYTEAEFPRTPQNGRSTSENAVKRKSKSRRTDFRRFIYLKSK
jgi:hypothetical protein